MSGAAAGLMMANNIARLMKDAETATETWRVLGARGLALGREDVGTFAAASGKQRPYLAGAIGELPVEVHIQSDFVHYATTVITVTPANGNDAVVGVHPSPHGLLGYLRSWIGQDIQVGDQGFDDAFLITGKPENAARELLSGALRDQLLGLDRARFAGLTYTRERVSVVLLGVETDAAALSAAIDLALAAAAAP
jgi:hypothetical protein